MTMKNKLDELEFNQVIKTSDVLPGIEGIEDIMGEKMRLVGKSYSFVGDNNVLQTIKIWAEGFNPDDFEQD